MSITTCKNCGHKLHEDYCSVCGEKRFDAKQLSVKHFAEETFEGLIHFDNKFFRTLKTLFIKPGQLSLDYVEGRRAGYMKPIPFFLVVNLLFFVLVRSNPYSLDLYNYVHYSPFIHFNTVKIVQDKIAALGVNYVTYSYLFNEQMKSASKEFIFVFIPLYGVISWLLFVRYKRLIVEHMVFATHFVVFTLCFFFFQTYLFTIPFYFISNTDDGIVDAISGILSCIILGWYFAVAGRRFYKAGIIWSIATALIIGVCVAGFIQIYRMILFYKIIYL